LRNIWISQGGYPRAQPALRCKDANLALHIMSAFFASQTWFFLQMHLVVFALMVFHGILCFKLVSNAKFHFVKIACQTLQRVQAAMLGVLGLLVLAR